MDATDMALRKSVVRCVTYLFRLMKRRMKRGGAGEALPVPAVPIKAFDAGRRSRSSTPARCPRPAHATATLYIIKHNDII
jgi:hypothetical protein